MPAARNCLRNLATSKMLIFFSGKYGVTVACPGPKFGALAYRVKESECQVEDNRKE